MTEVSALARGAHLTLTEAADACGVSHSTIKRKQSEFAHAYKDQTGTWRVPVSDLLGAGLHLRPRPAEPKDQADDLGVIGSDLAHALARIEALNSDLATERAARQVAEATARAYAANLDDLRFTMRALTGRPATPSEAPEPPPVEPSPPTHTPEPRRAAEPPPRRRWPWSRRD